MDKKKILIIACVAAVIIALGSVAYFMTMGGKNDGSSSSTDTTSSTANKTDATTANAEVKDACKLITTSDINAAFGLTFKDGTSQETAGTDRTSCKYTQTGDESPTALMKATNFSIDVESFATAKEAEASLTTTRKTDKIGDKVLFVVTDAPGVGDEAFFFQGQAAAIIKTEEYMYARKGRAIYHFIAIKLDGIDHEKVRPQMIQIAKKALN